MATIGIFTTPLLLVFTLVHPRATDTWVELSGTSCKMEFYKKPSLNGKVEFDDLMFDKFTFGKLDFDIRT
jgi:hypothetical protein